MSKEEINQAIAEMEHEIDQLQKKNMTSQIEVVRRRIELAQSYTIDPETIKIGSAYTIKGEQGRFIVRYLNGVMAWGSFENSFEERAFPFAIMTLDEKEEI